MNRWWSYRIGECDLPYPDWALQRVRETSALMKWWYHDRPEEIMEERIKINVARMRRNIR